MYKKYKKAPIENKKFNLNIYSLQDNQYSWHRVKYIALNYITSLGLVKFLKSSNPKILGNASQNTINLLFTKQ